MVNLQARCLVLSWAHTWECIGVPLYHIHTNICCHLYSWWWPFWLRLRWNLKVILIFICLIAKDVRHVLKCSLATFIFWNFSVQYFSPFLIFFYSLMFSFSCSLYIVETDSNEQLIKIASRCMGWLPVHSSLGCAAAVWVHEVPLLIVVLFGLTGVLFGKCFPLPLRWSMLPVCSSRSFGVLFWSPWSI